MSAHDNLSFLQLSWNTFQSVLIVFIIAFSGFCCTYSGILPKEGQKVASMMNVNLLTPCLIFSTLAKSLSLKKLIELFVVPVFYAVLVLTSYLSGTLVSKILQFDIDETHFVIGTSVFPNSNSLPVSLMMSLAYTLPELAWSEIENDSGDKIASRGILYLVMFQQIDQTLRWSWGVHKLLRWSGETDSNRDTVPPESSSNNELLSEDGETPLDKLKNNLRYHWDNMVDYMNPPLCAIFLSIAVASIKPLQRRLFEDDGFVKNTFTSSIQQMGNVSIPLILVVLGANLCPSVSTPMKTNNGKKIVFASIISRMILPAFFILPIIGLSVKFIKVSILSDPVFLLVSFLLTTSPPAIQLTQITQINGFFEYEIVGVLLWGYTVMTLPMTIAMVSISLKVLQWVEE